MKSYLVHWKRFAFFASCFLFCAITIAHSQPEGTAVVATTFPLFALVPSVLGFVSHWAKKYFAEGVAISWKDWLVKNFGWTITALVAALTGTFTLFATNPAMFAPLNAGTWIALFTIAWAADSANSIPASRTAPLVKE
jgi:hypothetical protein